MNRYLEFKWCLNYFITRRNVHLPLFNELKKKQQTACVSKRGDILLKCFHIHTHSKNIDL